MEDEYDYRKDLMELEEFNDMLESYLEEEEAESWTCIYKDEQFYAFINYQGEIRTIGCAYIDELFKKD